MDDKDAREILLQVQTWWKGLSTEEKNQQIEVALERVKALVDQVVEERDKAQVQSQQMLEALDSAADTSDQIAGQLKAVARDAWALHTAVDKLPADSWTDEMKIAMPSLASTLTRLHLPKEELNAPNEMTA
jgi:hypothetical protein